MSRTKATGPAKAARAQLALLAQAVGNTRAEIAAMFGVCEATVSSDLKLARSTPVITRAIEILASRCVPKAIETYDVHLDGHDLDAARDVLFGMGILKREAAVAVEFGPTIDDIRAELMPPVLPEVPDESAS